MCSFDRALWRGLLKGIPLLFIWLGVTPSPAAEWEILLSESFEHLPLSGWRGSWGRSERTQEKARDGNWSIKEFPENVYGLSVWYREIAAYPRADYRVTAWVFVPTQDRRVTPALSINRLNWSTLSAASTETRDEWVQLRTEYRNQTEQRLRIQLFQKGQRAGLGGSVLYWDQVTIERRINPPESEDGMKLNPYVLEGLEVAPAGGMRLRVLPGKIDVGGRTVVVERETLLTFAPPRVIEVRNEVHTLSEEIPRGYGGGSGLRQCIGRGAGIRNILVPDSLKVGPAAGSSGGPYVEGTDWRADRSWGRVGRIPGGGIGSADRVAIDYDISLMRLDTIAVDSSGEVVVARGAEDRLCPRPGTPDAFQRALCNVYLPYHCRELGADSVYPIGPPFPSPTEQELKAKAALVPGTWRKLLAGEELTIVFWGDSVTCGGDASSQEKAFPLSFTNWLRTQFPAARIRYVNAGTGGWNSNTKLPLFEKEVLAKRPDLVIIEFVNDMGLTKERVFSNYSEAVSRVRAIGGECIILTPHFTRPDWMGGGGRMRTKETRPAVGFLKEFAEDNGVGLADASRRWEHLWVEGLPYLTLLQNAINHPDDRGHDLFVQELKLFFMAGHGTSRAAKVGIQGMPERDEK